MKMTENQAKAYVKAHLEEYLASRHPDVDLSKHFSCLNPDHPDKNPSMNFDHQSGKVRCWSACNKSFDTFDVMRFDTGKTGADLFNYAYDYFGLEVEGRKRQGQDMKATATPTKATEQDRPKPQQKAAPEPQDLTAYFTECKARIHQTRYARERGFSPSILDKYGIGFDPAFRHPKAPATVGARPYLIVPTSAGSCTARIALHEVPDQVKKYAKMNVGPANLFNAEVLQTATRPVFIAEGELDALSILEVGFLAVGLGSVNNVNLFLEYTAQVKPQAPIVLCLDNDESGKKATEKLEEELAKQGLSFFRRNIAGAYKDQNEALIADRDAFAQAVQKEEASVQEEWSADYMSQTSAKGYIDTFLANVCKRQTAIPTGFEHLDKILDGGLYPGLYCLGGMSSNGKTTFCWQAVDQIAEAGHDVLVFTLEQSRDELISKSLSRYTLEACNREGLPKALAKTMRGILDGKRHENYNQAENRLIENAIRRFMSHGDHIFMIEGSSETGTAEIRGAIERHILYRRTRPVVMIDYLQVLKPKTERLDTKQAVDRNISDLRRISRDFNLPVLVISSLNRASYEKAVDLDSFKESGNIEYSCDVVIGLDLDGIKEFQGGNDKQKQERREFIEQAKSVEYRDIAVTILKNRNGKSYVSASYSYSAMFNRFSEKKEQ